MIIIVGCLVFIVIVVVLGTTTAAATTTTTATHNDVSTDHGTNDTEHVRLVDYSVCINVVPCENS